MKLGYTVAAPDGGAPSLALHGDFQRNLEQVRQAGFDGAELYLRNPAGLDPAAVARAIDDAGLAMPAICTGEVYGTDGLCFAAEDPSVRRAALDRTRAIIAFAAHWKAPVNIGRLRGPVPAEAAGRERAAEWIEEAFRQTAEVAQAHGVFMILEPINKHEINFINTTAEGIDWVRRVDHPAFALMLDLYHVALEDPSLPAAFVAAHRAGVLRHVHLCDSNRLAPGWGNLDTKDILATLDALGYQGWVTVECLQRPDADAAARQAGSHLRAILTSRAN